MSNTIYAKSSGNLDPFYGKFEHPIKALIEHESNAWEKNKGILPFLFNVEKSGRYSETTLNQTGLGLFQGVKEGQSGENDSVSEGFKKTISHYTFMKEVHITKEMLEDSTMGFSADLKNVPRELVRAYNLTKIELGVQALINGTGTSFEFNKHKIDTTTGDGLSLFNSAHPYKQEKLAKKPKQSNYFYGELTGSADAFEDALNVLANRMRNLDDENGNAMNYIADTLIIPSNRPGLEKIAKKVIGSERTVGSDYNDINTQYGQWNIVVLPGWRTTDDRFMIMSREANKNLMGSMFYNRRPLEIKNWVDESTWNYNWSGRCRVGVGFNTWKHIMLGVNSAAAVAGATQL